MAERRMFSRTLLEGDKFSMMSKDARILYLYLNLEADDDGFVSSVRKAMILADVDKAKGDSILQELITQNFVIKFESGILLLTHWRQNNQIRSDRHHETTYQKELSLVCFNEKSKTYELVTNKVYQVSTKWQPSDNQMSSKCLQNVTPMVDELLSDGKPRLDKTRLGKVSIEEISQDESSSVQTSVGESGNYDEIFKNYNF